MSNSDSDNIEQNTAFGDTLRQARKAQKLSIDEIAEQLKVPIQIISAIEQSDVEQLPAPTFTRGYLRAYAKQVEISDVNILAAYDRVMPRKPGLKPRSNLPGKTTSQSPLIKAVTFILVILGVLAVIYSSYQYYDKKAGSMKASLQDQTELNAGEASSQVSSLEISSLNEPKQTPLPVKKNIRSTSSETRIIANPDRSSGFNVKQNLAGTTNSSAKVKAKGVSVSIRDNISKTKVKNVPVAQEGVDSIQLLARKGAWVEIRDATGKRLYYNMLPQGKWVSFKGTAPFKVSIGNARSTSIRVNNLTIDMSKHIRSNNVAQFKVSTIERNGHQVVVFH